MNWVRGRRQRWRRVIAGLLAIMFGVPLSAFLLSISMERTARPRLFTPDRVAARPVAIVFGARVRSNGSLSSVLHDRVLTAVELYHAGRVHKLLMTGDNSHHTYNEPVAMKRFAVEHGVPADDIVLDYAGFRTYDSCYRARAIFGVEAAILVSQEYHLPRALYIARALGIDAVGCRADRHRYARQRWFTLREQASRSLAWLQVNVTRPRPKFLGPRLPIAT